MPHPDQAPESADGPESVYQVYLTADVRPAIRAATTGQMRGILAGIARHLCHYLRHDIGGFPLLGPDRRQPWQVCQAGCGTRAGFQLYQHLTQAIAGSYLQSLGFDPARAAAEDTYFTTQISPFLRHARTQRLRRTLLSLADHLHTVVGDSDTAAHASAAAQPDIPDDLWEVAVGVGTAIQLYRHVVRVLAVHVLFYIWDGLDIAGGPVLRPFTDADVFATHLN